ncbi:hypothetical protein [Alkalicoccus saliphilus]|uniref:Uncharacterized protein n=1 Tax=Alkalicoccus saliphilus TaxID=200989 RepID=A0A2T4U904_9BACI|nr:hypothetical protein [Alkalicoccus saliphilus]PTL39878.1 hypothetical protein C6Y45_04335 [Alkalicoccus saliphilus]
MEKGKKILAAGVVVTFISLFFTWINVLIVNLSGFSSDAVFLLAAIVYPAVAVFLKKRINKIGGFVSVGAGVLLILYFLAVIASEPMASPASGPFVAAIGLGIIAYGIIKDTGIPSETVPSA